MAKKLVDTWKTKKWYAIRAPKIFNEVEVSEVPAQDETRLLNRVIEIPLKDITKDIAHIYASVRLRVSEVKGNSAHTKFIGHSLSREYLATLVRRYRDKLDIVLPLKSKDGVYFTVKAVVVTQDRVSGRQRKALHAAFVDFVKARARETDFAPLVLDMIYGKFSQEAHAMLHKLAPIRRVEVRKTVLTEWFDSVTNMPLPAPPVLAPEQPMEAPAPAAEPAPAMAEAPAAPEEQPAAV